MWPESMSWRCEVGAPGVRIGTIIPATNRLGTLTLGHPTKIANLSPIPSLGRGQSSEQTSGRVQTSGFLPEGGSLQEAHEFDEAAARHAIGSTSDFTFLRPPSVSLTSVLGLCRRRWNSASFNLLSSNVAGRLLNSARV